MLGRFTKLKAALVLSLVSGSAMAQVDPVKASNDSLINQIRADELTDNIPVISLDENDGQDGSAQNVSSLLSAGRDPFLNAATFKFNAVRFRIRGYDADMFSTYMNGIPMENLDNGFTPYGQWGGLNDVLRNRDVSHGLRNTPYAFGDFGGLTYIDTRASYQRQQTSFNYAVSNRNYNHRLMASHSTGLNKKGWAFTISGSRRWAEEGYTEGTYYDGWSLFAGVDKRINDKHLLSFVAFATPTENGRQGASVREMLDIAGDNYYNPYWGYQNGRKRNSSVARSFQPMGILSHDWKITDKMQLFTSASFSKGYRSTTGLDWYNAPDPRPDYYRYLPSWQLDPIFKEQVYNELRNDVNKRQINWDNIYNVNLSSWETFKNADGIQGNDLYGRRSHYILEERVIGITKANFNTVLNTALKSNIDLTAGFTYQYQRNQYYKIVEDLLGGDFYVDINQFAERDYPTNNTANQNDLNRPNRIVREGDKVGYNYDINIRKASAFVQTNIKLRKVDFFLAAEHTYTRFWRVGNVRTGLFPNNSFGKSKYNDFYNYGVKGGATYKIDGRNYIFANAGYQTRAPFFDNAYLAPRTRDFMQEDITSEKISTIEGGYVMNAPSVKLRLTGFYTRFEDQMNVLTFYNDEYQNFTNYAISNIDKDHFGIEFGAEAKVYKGLSLTAAASVGRYRFISRQRGSITVDNSAELLARNTIIYSNNYYVPTPQEAYTIGFAYNSPKFWWFNMNLNYFRHMYLDFNPLRRSETVTSGLEPGSELWNKIVDQEQLENQFTLDAFAGYSYMLNRNIKGLKTRNYLVFTLGVNNILNNQEVVSGGFEQLRFDFTGKDTERFPPRRFYAYGINFFASIGLRF
ncbi:MAG TPA: TonB-dependent receptor [Ferruginibacter sp.]|nr:TonB-dependent receptor [Ferruginibacter sp.]HRQ21325.1 TonB-dependent receptor [Ferruginibacter sp.]